MRTVKMKYNHGEAFKLMKYVSERDGFVEWLWNSRDGVTPFAIGDAREGVRAMMQHADWHEDVFIPNFTPPEGSRIFMDHSPITARESAERRVELARRSHPDLGGREVETLMDGLVKEVMREPRVVTVTRDLAEDFQRLAAEDPVRPGRAG